MSKSRDAGSAISRIVDAAAKSNVSYLYIARDSYPLAKVGLRELKPLAGFEVTEPQILEFINEKMPESHRHMFSLTGYARFAFAQAPGLRCRVDVAMTVKGPALVIHITDEIPPNLESLGLAEVIGEFPCKGQGVFLVCSKPRSGRSAALASLVEKVNQTSAKHIVWISQAAEYSFTPGMSFICQFEIPDIHHTGAAVPNLSAVVPDIAVVDMLPNQKILEQSLFVAENGAQVFLGVQSTDTAHGLEALVNAVDPNTRKDFRYRLSRVFRFAVYLELLKGIDNIVPAAEVLSGTEPVNNLLKEGKFARISETIPTGAKYGMETLEKSKERLSAKGLI